MDNLDIPERGMPKEIERRCEETGKRIFTSISHAKKAMYYAKFRYRVYYCGNCRNYHVSNEDKIKAHEKIEFDYKVNKNKLKYYKDRSYD